VFCTKSFNYEVITMARYQPTVQICVPPYVLRELQAIADRELSTISTVGRRALVRGLGLEERSLTLNQANDEADTSQASR
jgi:hypothetical protein